MGLGLGLGIQFKNSLGRALSEFLTWGQSIPARFWGTTTPEYWGGLDAQAEAHYNRVIADGGVVPAGLGGVNSFFQVVKGVYGTSDINTAISAAYDPHYLGYKLGAGSGTTLGQAARTLYSCSGASADVTQTTAASQPLLLEHSGTNYAFFPSVGAATPNSITTTTASSRIPDSFDIRVYFSAPSSQNVNIISSYDAAPFRWLFARSSANKLQFYSNNNTQNWFSTLNYTTVSGWVRFTRNKTTGEGIFYTSNDSASTDPMSVSWTLFESIAGGTTSVSVAGADLVSIGFSAGNSGSFNSKIYRATISNSIGGTPVVDFNPSSYNPATSQTQWSSATGEVWSINVGTATSGYKGVLVDRTIVQTDGVDDNIASSSTAFTATSVITRYSSLNGLTSANSAYLISSLPSDNTMLFWKPSGTTAQMFNGTGINITGYSNNSLKLYTSLFNGASSLSLTNNANQNTGSEGTATIRGVMLGNRSGALNAPANAIYNTIIYSSLADNSTQQTAMYNALKSYNNGAF